MSKVRISGLNTESHCGYCKSYGSSSFGITSNLMRSSDYESLMLKGWRRCGSYYYKPDVPNSCCKLNTIRCDVANFQASKNQKKAKNRFDRFLSGTKSESEKKNKRLDNRLQVPEQLSNLIKQALIVSLQGQTEFIEHYLKIKRNMPNRTAQFGHYSISSTLVVCSINKNIEKSAFHELLLQSISKCLENSQWSILNSKNFHININDSQPNEAAGELNENRMEVDGEKHEYTTEIVPADFSQESFEVYKEYQISIHHDDPNSLSKAGYSNFLCGKNLIAEKPSAQCPLGLGNFHQLHRIDGKLIAVGVLDFLPSGVSSVYFFYSPKYQNLSLGVISALKEIELVQNNKTETFKYYYMGFYIDTCQKMKYKGEYLPSQLLCPKNYVWVNIEKCLQNKEAHRFLELHQCDEETKGKFDDDMNWNNVNYLDFLLENMKIELNSSVISLKNLNQSGISFVASLMLEAQRFFSKSLIKRLVFKFS